MCRTSSGLPPARDATTAQPQAIASISEFDKPSLREEIPGCPFAARCTFATDICRREMPLFDQELLRRAQIKGPLTDTAYTEARALCLKATRSNGIDAVLQAHKLDAMVTLTAGPAWLIDPINGDADSGGCSSPAAIAGYPHITVPAGLWRGLPVGLSFFGAAFSEPTLIKLASGFESVAQARVAPRL